MDTPGDVNLLWPEGNNKELLYAMIHYIQQILQDHGTRLISEELIKLSKVKSDMKKLLFTLNGTDFSIPDLNFTLPGIYKFYNSTLADDNISSGNTTNVISSRDISMEYTEVLSVSPPNTLLTNTSITSTDNILLNDNISVMCDPKIQENDNHSIQENKENNDTDDTLNEKYKMFDTFLCKLKEEDVDKINETSAHYLVFLEEARKKYNLQFTKEGEEEEENSKYVIESLNNVPSLKPTLYKIRYIQSISPKLNEIKLFEYDNNKYKCSYNYNPYIKQCIAIKGYYNSFLSVYKNGQFANKKYDIGHNEIFYTIPIINNNKDNNQVYICTNDKLYLGSDENGLLFVGNIKKEEYQTWNIEFNENDKYKYSFKNNFGLYLTINNSNVSKSIIANSIYKKDLEKFQIYVIDEKEFIKKRNTRKMSIDDMDIIPIKISAPKLYRTRSRGHFRANSQSINNNKKRYPPPPNINSHHQIKRRKTPPPPKLHQTNSNNNYNNYNQMYLKIGISNDNILKELKQKHNKLKRYRKSNHDIEKDIGKVNTSFHHRKTQSMMINMTGNNALINELKKKLQRQRKSIAIDERFEETYDDDNDDDDNDDNDKKEMEMEKEKEMNNENDNDNDDNKKKEKPALPSKSAKIVVRQIRSKYQRPLPAVPQYDNINQIDHQID